MSEKIIKYSSEKHISAAEAAKISGYHQDYIGQLCRGGKIEGIRAGRDWLVDIDKLLAYKKSQVLLKKLNSSSDSWDKELLGLEEKSLEEKKKFVFPQLGKILVPIASVLIVSVLIFGYYAYADEIENVFSNIKDVQHSVSNTIAEISLPEIKVNLPKIELPEISNTVSGAGAVVETVGNIFSKTAKSIFTETKDGFAMFPQNLKELVQELFPFPEQKIIVQKTLVPQPAPQKETQSPVAAPATSERSDGGQVQKTIVEKTIERIISGLTSEELDQKLQTLNNKIMAEVINLKNQLSQRTDNPYNATVASTYQAVALTNKIDNLSGVTINNSTISGTLAGLTDAMIPDTITASNYLSLAGGTISGAITIPYLTATSTTATSTFPYLAVSSNSNLGTIIGGTWQGSAIADTYISSAATWNNKWDLASTTIGTIYGGTGTSTAPTYGKILVGTSAGVYQLQATSTLGITQDLSGYLLGSNYYGTTTHPLISSLPALSITKSQVSDFGTYEAPLTFNYPLTRATNAVSIVATSSMAINTDNLVQGATNLFNQTHTGDVTGSVALTIGANKVLDTMINFGTGATQINTADVPELTNLYYTDSRANSYIHASTTIPKLYTANTWTGLNIFGNASTTLIDVGTVLSGTWNGTAITVAKGGTGLTSTPTFGQVLRGTGTGYALVSTSTLGIALSDTTGNYVADVAAGTAITIGGTAGKAWTATVNVTADSISDTQLAYNTGQNLTTASTPTFAGATLSANLTLGANTLTTTNQTKVANLNADLLDGFDSSAFGDATLANQTTILSRIGTNADAASMSDTLFAGQQYIWDNRASFGGPGNWTCTIRSASGASSATITASCSGSEKVISCGVKEATQFDQGNAWFVGQACVTTCGGTTCSVYANCCY